MEAIKNKADEEAKGLRDISFVDVFKGRRSIRHFTDQRVSDAELKGIIDDASWAPSPGNSQEWEVVALSHQQTSRVLENYEDLGWAYIFPLLREVVRRSQHNNNQKISNLNASTHEFYRDYLKVTGSPRLLLVCKRKRPRHQDWWAALKVPFSRVAPFFTLLRAVFSMRRVNANLKSAGLANLTYAMTLSASSNGLASCIQGVYCNLEKKIINALGLDNDLEIFLTVLIGHEDPGRPDVPDIFTTRKSVLTQWVD